MEIIEEKNTRWKPKNFNESSVFDLSELSVVVIAKSCTYQFYQVIDDNDYCVFTLKGEIKIGDQKVADWIAIGELDIKKQKFFGGLPRLDLKEITMFTGKRIISPSSSYTENVVNKFDVEMERFALQFLIDNCQLKNFLPPPTP